MFSNRLELGFRRIDPIEKVSNFWTGTYRFNVANGWNQTNFMINVDPKKLKSRNSAYAVLGTVLFQVFFTKIITNFRMETGEILKKHRKQSCSVTEIQQEQIERKPFGKLC